MRKDDKPTIDCWNCGQSTMAKSQELGEGWRKCTNCGATDFPSRKGKKSRKIRPPTIPRKLTEVRGGC